MAHYNRPLPSNDPRHGSYAGYSAGCLLPCCAAAFARYKKRLRHDWSRGVRRTVDPTGFRRRVRALQAAGWPLATIADRIGSDKGSLSQSLRDTQKVTLRRHAAVAALYAELEGTPGPSVKAQRWAELRGWPGPDAWTAETIDDPQAEPYLGDVDIDPVVVQRILAGDWRLRATRAERLAVFAAWRAAGGSVNALTERTGWNIYRDRRLAAAEESAA